MSICEVSWSTAGSVELFCYFVMTMHSVTYHVVKLIMQHDIALGIFIGHLCYYVVIGESVFQTSSMPFRYMEI